MKKILFLTSMLVLMSCQTQQERIKHECKEPDTIPIYGHPHLSVKVGSVGGQSTGTTYQLVHHPECSVCKKIRISELDSILETKAINYESND